jgi:hypothetical protein
MQVETEEKDIDELSAKAASLRQSMKQWLRADASYDALMKSIEDDERKTPIISYSVPGPDGKPLTISIDLDDPNALDRRDDILQGLALHAVAEYTRSLNDVNVLSDQILSAMEPEEVEE